MKHKKVSIASGAALVAALSLGALGGSGDAVSAAAPKNNISQAPNKQKVSSSAAKQGLNKERGAVMNWRGHRTVTAATTKPTAQQKAATSNAVKEVQAAPMASLAAAPSGISTPAVNSATATTTFQPQLGIDVSGYSGKVDWATFKANGVKFTFAKVTEGNYYTSKDYAQQVAGAKAQGIITGAYHFANPSVSSGASQADFAVSKGGGWTPGKLPLALDMEYNPYEGNTCYNKTPAQLNAWAGDFQERYKALTGTYPIIYTTTSWWNQCMGSGADAALVAAKSPLWNAYYQATPGKLPYTWNHLDFWQTNAITAGSYDTDIFNGGPLLLQAYTKVRK